MATDLNIAGISRTGASGSYSYSVIGSPNKPVTYVSWGDAARFANWLHNGQPTGLQDASTTENGAYTLNGATSDAALNSVSRNTGAVWVIPSEDEWYKAAYHKNDGVTSNYWDYPTSTNSVPYSDQPSGTDAPDHSNTGNFYNNDGFTNFYNDGYAVTGSTVYSSSQNYLTYAAAYGLSNSPYRTYDQGGNVFEWNEALITGSGRVVRGGSFNSLGASFLQSSIRNNVYPSDELNAVGFRVATIPEPGTAVLAIVGCVLMLCWRKRRK
jgi:formylglycine-generating enzyme required for sulfatase activity